MNTPIRNLQAFVPSQRPGVGGMGSSTGGSGRGSCSSIDALSRRAA